MGDLVRAGAWFGLGGAVLFVATAIAMLIRNGCSLTGGMGFRGGWAS